MKTISKLFMLILLCLATGTVVYANDGSLRIDTSLNQSTEKTDIQYFEQESDLAKLFKVETTSLVEKLQKISQESYAQDKTSIFMETIKTENIVENYQPLLFTPETMVKSKDSYGVSLNQKTSVISWQMVLLFAGGVCVMIYSVISVRGRHTTDS